jgi:starch synthase (maltosyl-transferring)
VPKKSDRRITTRGLERITIECVAPELDSGRFPVKRIVGAVVWIGADIFKEGHDQLTARVVFKGPGDATWSSASLSYHADTDRWYAPITVDRIGRWTYSVEAWTDAFSTWRTRVKKKVDADQDVQLELLEGAHLARSAAHGAKVAPIRAALSQTARVLEDRHQVSVEQRVSRALDDELAAMMHEHFKPGDLTRFGRELTIVVDREKARYSTWYEMFPRSAGESHHEAGAGSHHERSEGPVSRHGTFADAAAALPRIAKLGFDVVYLPPIHPVGRTFRKGKNNSLAPEPDDVGSPWAIGNEHGGHTAIEPALGTFDDFARFVATAKELEMEVALDYALQCSPDHPWVKEHPEWFHIRPDGTIAYAENPPKKYQDIYPLNFWCVDRERLWAACRDVVLFWIERGVKIFRVDNPHTKAFSFWEWMIADVLAQHPDTIFFSEAFARPKKMKLLAKLGFTMSYTYFTWKNSSSDLRGYVEELSQGAAVEYFRGNFFTNTPDILNEYLVAGGRAAFRIRLLLAATLSPLYGIYSGFELCENTPVRPGSEEYLDSEKYQLKPRDWNAAGNINDDVARVNAIRRQHAALQRADNVTFHTSDNPTILFYRRAGRVPAKQWVGSHWQPIPQLPGRPEPLVPRGRLREGVVPSSETSPVALPGATTKGDVLIAVTTDPTTPQETMVHVPIAEMGIGEDEPYVMRDLLTGAKYTWRGVRNYVRLDPATEPAHVFVVERPSA